MEERINKIEKELKEHEKRIIEMEKFISEQRKLKVSTDDVVHDTAKLAEKMGISSDKLKEIFDTEQDRLTLLKFVGVKDEDKTQNITLLTLLGYRYFFNTDEVSSQEIRRNVAENRVPLHNFATHLNGLVPTLIRRKGESKSPKTTYRLMIPGEVKARDLLKNILENSK